MSISIRSRSRSKSLVAGLAALVLMGGMVSTASAVTLFSDNFNRNNSNTVGNGWSEIQNSSNDVGIFQGQAYMRDSVSGLPDAAITHSLSTTGYENIKLSYDWREFFSSDPSDSFYVQIDTGSGFSSLASHGLGGSGYETSMVNLIGADNLASISLRLAIDVTDNFRGNLEGVFLDNIIVTGDAISTPGGAAVPEPSTIALFGTGLVGMGIWRTRRNKKEQSA